MHRGAFCQFPFRWIYYCHSSKFTGKETGKTHLCAVCWTNLLFMIVLQMCWSPLENFHMVSTFNSEFYFIFLCVLILLWNPLRTNVRWESFPNILISQHKNEKDRPPSYLSELEFCNPPVWNIKVDELDFFLTLNLIFLSAVVCKI